MSRRTDRPAELRGLILAAVAFFAFFTVATPAPGGAAAPAASTAPPAPSPGTPSADTATPAPLRRVPASSPETTFRQAGQKPRDPMIAALPLTFDSEWIRLYIEDDSLEVRGTYWLYCRSRSDRELPLFYPFPRDSLLGGARMVSVRARVGGEASAPMRVDNLPQASGVRWLVPPCTGDTIEIEAVYRQELKSEYARYIVTTTKAWDRPLRQARFEIHLPPKAHPVEFSFPFTRKERNGEAFYAFEAMSFLPDRDIVVRWKL